MKSEDAPLWDFSSALPYTVWPAVQTPAGAAALTLLFQMESSQWLAPERLALLQTSQLGALLRHAHATVPYYREGWTGRYDPVAAITPERFTALPILTRRDLQTHFEELRSTAIPPAHGLIAEVRSSGSTGAPIRILRTDLNLLFWKAFTLRDHLWHRRELGGKLAAIRLGRATGTHHNWGPATEGLVETGPSAILSADNDIDTQLRWLLEQDPDYLISYPSIVRELARRSLELGARLTKLREVRTFGELLPTEVRELCREAWNAPVSDTYSSEETGYIALQCPQHEHYHVQSEGVLVEILDDQGAPCAPGQAGRVIITSLHNFAIPLIRYEVGDYAEFGEPCSCGRGLPVMKRILGRVRNTLVTAYGKRYWPPLGSRKFFEIAPVLQHQLVQKQFDLVEVRLVTAAPITPGQEESLRQVILSGLPAGIRLKFTYHESIPRSAGGKFEDFISEVAAST